MTRYTQTETGIDPLFISVKQAAAALNITAWQTYRLLDDQLIDSRYIGRRRLVNVDSLRAYAGTLPIYPAGPAS